MTRAQVDRAEGKVIAWTAGGNDQKWAYNFLRHRGVPLIIYPDL
jgi:hypothetical protein